MHGYTPKLRGPLTGKISMTGVRVRLSLDRSAALKIDPELLYRADGKGQAIALSSLSFNAGRTHYLVFPLPAKADGLPLGTPVQVSMKLTATLRGDKRCTDPQHLHGRIAVQVAQLERPPH